MILKRNIIYPLAGVMLSALAMVSCGSESVDTPDTPENPEADSTVTLNISALPLGDASTRAENFTDEELAESPASANELINNWVVAFCRGGQVMAVVDGASATGVWNDRVNVELPRGTGYSAVALANVNIPQAKDRFKVGTVLDADWKDMIFDETNMAPLANGLIPMSGYLENFSIKGTVNEEFAVEVVRMKAKIEYAVKNLSNERIEVQGFSFTPAYNGSIYLFPEYDKKPVPDTQNPAVAPRIPAPTDGGAASYITVNATAPAGFVLEANSTQVKRGSFYIKESIVAGNHPTGHFHLGLRLKRGEAAVEDVTYALAADELTFIYRNDYILFPIVITDYVPEFEVIDYPPIGGYPVTVKAENNEFYATFSNSGAFDISARLRDGQGRTVAIKPYDGSGSQDNYVRFLADQSTVPDNFSLVYDGALGTWQGNFTHGAAQPIILVFEFKIGTLLYTRTLHLISK